MLRYIIIEDEPPAARRLEKMINAFRPEAEMVAHIESVSEASRVLSNKSISYDLIFLDIQLADGLSFEIFKTVEINSPVIFTTAFDDYMLQAFKVNSIDYLLKPIDKVELGGALEQFSRISSTNKIDQSVIEGLLTSLQEKHYKERFLIKSGQQLNVVPIASISYFFSEDGYVNLVTNVGKKHLIEYSLDQLSGNLDPKDFFRINRKFILHVDCISKIQSYFNSRLKLSLSPNHTEDVIVSRERVVDFKKWLDR